MKTKSLGWIILLAGMGPAAHCNAADRPPKVSYASFGPLNTAIYIADADGGHERQLIDSAELDVNPSLSPDGRWVIFSSRRNGSADLYRIGIDGSRLERLTDHAAYDDQAAFSPNGKQVVFVSSRAGQADIWLLDLRSRTLRNLTDHPGGDYRPAWSPDGKWIAFTSDRDSPGALAATPRSTGRPFSPDQKTQIYVMRVDGTGLRRLTSGEASVGGASWSPRGESVAFYEASATDWRSMGTDFNPLPPATSQIVSIVLATGARTVHTSGPGRKFAPEWLTDGRIAYLHGPEDDRHRIRGRVIPPTAGMAFTDGSRGVSGEYSGVSWSRDGARFVFHRALNEEWPPMRPTASVDPSFTLVRAGVFADWSPDGAHVVTNTALAASYRDTIIVMSTDGTGRRVIVEDPESSASAPVWSPSGNEIAFGYGKFFLAARAGGRADIAVAAPDGSAFRLITKGEGNFGFPSWSPDGSRLVCRSVDGQSSRLVIVDAKTGDVVPLTDGESADSLPAWSPDGSRILFLSDRDGDWDLYTIRPDGADIRRVTSSPGNDAHARWSGDGKWIAFASARGGFKDEMPIGEGGGQPAGDIFVMRADGTDVRRLTDDAYEDGTPDFEK
jgi:TolB protein